MFDVEKFRQQFPFFQQHSALIYLDSAASSQKPSAVLNAMTEFYQQNYSNVHRGAYALSQLATAQFEDARLVLAKFLNAADPSQIIWTSGATMALNQLAFGLMGTVLNTGDCVLLTALEHHANIVPWQFHGEPLKIAIEVTPLDANNQLDLAAFQQLLHSKRPKVVSFTHVANGLGHRNPIAKMVQLAKEVGAITIIDGSQGISDEPVDVQALDCDFYLCSGHKLYGPTGIGVLYGKTEQLAKLRPLCYGGEMIKQVSFHKTTLNDLPFRLEAGTPNIVGAIGFAAAVRWYTEQNQQDLHQHKQQLLQQLWQGLAAMPELEIFSSLADNAGIVSCNIRHEHPSDFAVLLDQQHVAARAGTHCAMPLFQALQQPGAVRFSLAPYNTADEINRTLQAVKAAVELLQ